MIELGRLVTEIDLKKLDFFGEDYVTEYADIEFERIKRERAYQGYLAKGIELIAYNTVGGKERYTLERSYSDIVDQTQEESNNDTENTVEVIRERQHKVFQKLLRG